MTENDPLATRAAPVLTANEADTVRALIAAGFTDPEEIGRGGFGVVYRCRQESLDRTVAVKVLSTTLDPDNLDRFLREQRAMGRLSGHPHIVTVLQAGTGDTGLPYLVMHYHPHDSLEARIRRHGPLEWPEAIGIGIKVAGALETAHRNDVLHRDVKPGNILITEYGEPQLTDFGIARVGGGFRTSSGAITGSPAFTAPEILRGDTPAAAADVYGLAATLFCAITGHAAYERREGEKVVAQFLRITSEPIPDLRGGGLPDSLCEVLERAMSTDPAARPQSAMEFGEELRQLESSFGLPVDDMALPEDAPHRSAHDTLSSTASTTASGSLPSTSFTSPSTSPATRFRPPAANRPLIDRSRLIDLLRAGQRRRLTAIHAPTGFGKSTLAAQWRDVLADDGVEVAWLAVDSDDNNVLWFLTHLVEAVKQVRPQLGRQLAQILESRGDDAERYVLSTLIDDLHRAGVHMTLMIDDWHRVTSSETIAALDFLLERGCHHLQIVVTSRTQAGLPLSRMRMRDELVELDSSILRFDMDESDSFLREIGGLHLDREDVQDLNKSTEGWAAALQLASLSLRDSEDPTGMIENITGRHHAIGEFLADNVLSTLEPEIYEFLLSTSITESISGSLASTLTGNPRAQAMLEEIEQRDLFLRHIDDERVWFRYHHLFVDFLRRRLERDHPEVISNLHRKAAAWFERHHMLREAVDHALAADDTQFAVDLVATDGMYLMEHGRMTMLLTLIEKLPPRAVSDDPRLQLSLSWANGALQRAGKARVALSAARDALGRSTLPSGETAELRIEADVAEAAILMNADHVADIDRLIEPCLAAADTLRPWVVAAAAVFATYTSIFRFDFVGAARWQEWAEPYYRGTQGPFAGIYGRCLAGIAASELLDVATAEKHFRTALRIARRSGGVHSHGGRLAAAMLGELLYEQGRLTDAEALFDESAQLGIEGGIADFMIARFATAARLKVARGDRAAAVALLDEGQRAAVTHNLRRLRARVDNERVRLGLPTAPREPRKMPATDAPDPDGVTEVTAQVEDATAIRLLYSSGDPDSIAQAVEWARLWHRRTAINGRRRAHLQAARLLTACLHAHGSLEEAEQILAPAVEICGDRGMLRYLVDGGAHVVDVLASLRDRLREDRWPKDWPVVDAAFLDEMLRLTETGETSTEL
ncbi:protein kinase domain-containing protein [Rhodococcus artemisiae]|uniref:Serine/threonine-protein kinase PknK n=1 Tax=Rhodococcus artemisiae TaxID=714159 RepID=A0ABU7LEA8_9NOCA|nr:protein kinase [Rhodococcus artemisiae]MEE2059624.1 protein kinase [Rhodococcus artemisiae]